jgi:hypothetical protein
MNRRSFLALFAALGALSALVACSGSTSSGPGGEAGLAGSAGVAGTAAGGTSAGGTSAGGTSPGGQSSGGDAGASGGCTEGATMPRDCNTCQCHSGQWACTNIACPVKACGGFAGKTCSATEYCAYMPGQACGAADASSTCEPRPGGCPDIYMPVCGCDGMNYPSACDAAQHGQGVMQTGNCLVK